MCQDREVELSIQNGDGGGDTQQAQGQDTSRGQDQDVAQEQNPDSHPHGQEQLPDSHAHGQEQAHGQKQDLAQEQNPDSHPQGQGQEIAEQDLRRLNRRSFTTISDASAPAESSEAVASSVHFPNAAGADPSTMDTQIIGWPQDSQETHHVGIRKLSCVLCT